MRFSATVFLMLPFVPLGVAYGDAVSVTAQAVVYGIDGYTPCTSGQTLGGGTATAGCFGSTSSSATYISPFEGSAFATGGPVGVGMSSASVTVFASQYLTVLGGTGTGTLTLDFEFSGGGSENGNTLAAMEFDTNFGKIINPCCSCDQDGDCTWAFSGIYYVNGFPVGGTAESLTIPFTFGVPLLFTEDFEITASAGANCEACGASVNAEVLPFGWSVADANGVPVTDAELVSSIPEVAPFGPTGFGLALFMGEFVRRRKAKA